MDKTAKQIAAQVLELASNSFSNHGCNDFELPDTLANLSFVSAMNTWAGLDSADAKPYTKNGKIYTQDWQVMSYCAHLLKQES